MRWTGPEALSLGPTAMALAIAQFFAPIFAAPNGRVATALDSDRGDDRLSLLSITFCTGLPGTWPNWLGLVS